MDTLLIRDVESLAGAHRFPCISLYMPTDRTGATSQQSPVRFKNLLKEAAAQLAALGRTAGESKELLAPLGRLAEDFVFWSKQSDGLALFYSPDHLRTFHLPVHFAEQVTVGERFTLRPLMPMVLGDDLFYVLAVSRNEVRLIEAHGRRETAQRLAVRRLPKSLIDALGEQETTETLQYHTAAAERGRTAVFHGQGAGREDEKTELVRFARCIDAAVREALKPQTAPLVLAGADPLPAIYREVNDYPHLLAEDVAGNPDHASDAHLAARGWALVAPHLATELHAASDRFGALEGTGRASRKLEEILPAARQGRVATLFMDDRAAAVWGRTNGDVKRHPAPEPGDEDLLDAAAVAAWTQGATVFAVPTDQVPGRGDIAAIFRY